MRWAIRGQVDLESRRASAVNGRVGGIPDNTDIDAVSQSHSRWRKALGAIEDDLERGAGDDDAYRLIDRFEREENAPVIGIVADVGIYISLITNDL